MLPRPPDMKKGPLNAGGADISQDGKRLYWSTGESGLSALRAIASHRSLVSRLAKIHLVDHALVAHEIKASGGILPE